MNSERFVKTVASLVIIITLFVFTSFANRTRENYHDKVASGTATKSTNNEVSSASAGTSS